MLRYFLVLIAFASVLSLPARAEIYLGLRSTASGVDQANILSLFHGDWVQVIVRAGADGSSEVADLASLVEEYGTLEAVVATATANTRGASVTLRFISQDAITRLALEPPAATSGLLLLPEFSSLVTNPIGLDTTRLSMPLTDLILIQIESSSEIDQGFINLARRIVASEPNAQDDQVLGYADGQFTLIAAATPPPPTAEEILMSLGPDPENTLVITLATGDVVIRLRDDVAPNHTARIKELAREGFYDGIVFHRVIEGFMAQTGDPTGTGTSGSGQNLNAEFSDAPFLRGTVGMARAASPNSADSQFFIMFAEGRFLDNNYTVIGQVESGMEFVDQIQRGEPPANPDQMVRVQVQADM